MATVITSLGSKSEHTSPVNAQITVSTSSGSGTPWSGTVTYTSTDPTVNVGDILHYKDAYYNCDGYSSCANGPLEVDYLITAINTGTNTLTIRHIRGGIADSVDPFSNLDSDEAGTTAQPYIVRCFSSISTWEADLDTDVFYDSGDTAKGECYKDSAFSMTGSLSIDGGDGLSVGSLAHTILTVAESQRHDGTADTGAKVNLSTGGRIKTWYQDAYIHRTIEWLEFDGGDSDQSFGSNWRIVDLSTGSTTGHVGTAAHLLIHGCHNTVVGDGNGYGVIGAGSQYSYIHNNIIYDCSGRLRTPGILGANNGIVCNNTVHKIGMTYTSYAGDGSREAIGIVCVAGCVYKNNIAVGTYFADDGHDHEKYDYLANGGDVGTYNISGDSTASGSNSITGESASDLFVSCCDGSIDLHLKDESAALAAGDDLGTGFTVGSDSSAGSSTYGTAINVDIDGRDRDAEGDTWDIGADQCHTCSAGGDDTTNVAFMLFFD